MTHILDHPQWQALTTRHARLARRVGAAASYAAEVSAMSGLSNPNDLAAWRDLAELVGEGNFAILILSEQPPLPEFVRPLARRGLLQMAGPVEPPVLPPEPHGLVMLGPADGPEMVALAARTEPGPMLPRTVEMGDYWGVRRGGALVAMAGERLRLAGWTEVSGVCTDQDYRGQGLARYLVARLVRDMFVREERAFLHCELGNASAIALYETLGFTRRAEVQLTVAGFTGSPASS